MPRTTAEFRVEEAAVARGLPYLRVRTPDGLRCYSLDHNVELRNELEREHPNVLALSGFRHLDISQIRTGQRPATQLIGRALYERGYGVVRYGSERDDKPCYALYEDRAELEATGEPIKLGPENEPLQQVCREWKLTLEHAPTPGIDIFGAAGSVVGRLRRAVPALAGRP